MKDIEEKIKEYKERTNRMSIAEINEEIRISTIKSTAYCREHGGHVHDKEHEWTSARNYEVPKAHGFCKRCGFMYERNLDAGEISQWDKIMQTPMTI